MQQRIIVLAVLVVATLSASVYLYQRDMPEDLAPEKVLLGELVASANLLNQVAIESADGVVFEAVKDGDNWVATHLDASLTFPVSEQAMKDLVSALSQARVVEEKTANPNLYSKLGVEGLDSADAQASLVRLSSPNKQWRLLIGNIASSGIGHFVRQPNQARSFLIDQTIELPLTRVDWLDNTINVVDMENIVTITWSQNRTNELTIRRNEQDDTQWVLEEMTASELPTYPEVFAAQVDKIQKLQFNDVKVSLPEDVVGQPSYGITLTDSQGFQYEYKLFGGQDDNGYQLYISSDDKELWTSYWLFDIDSFESSVFKLSRQDLVQ